jgi:hypothetical protein
MKYLLYILPLFVLTLISCDPDDPDPVNEEEVITTLTYTLQPTAGGSPVVFSFRDIDGDGGLDPMISAGSLAANTEYNGSVTLLNETEDPAEDITEEVREEDDEHQLFYVISGANANIIYLDQDGDGNPLGLMTRLTTGEASTGTITVILRHEPDKSVLGADPNDPVLAGGETDIEVTFNLDIQ